MAVNPGAPPPALSYRVADASTPNLDDLLPSFQGSLVNKFMAELIINEPSYLNEGVPPTKLVQYIEAKQTNLSRKEIVDAIRAELNSGNLDTFENGQSIERVIVKFIYIFFSNISLIPISLFFSRRKHN